MREQKMKRAALDLGFDYAVFLDVEDLVFDHSFRGYCEENVCGNYGANHSCPPDCGTVQEMEERARQYCRAMVLETIQSVDSFTNYEQMLQAKHVHNELSRLFLEEMEKEKVQGLPMLAGPCTYCKECLKKWNKPCAYPEKRTSCLSAYCLNAGLMAQRCGLPYWCGDQKIAYFTLFLFEKEQS